ncbi:11915_t:CDS:2 [Ambispora leptoticha]|uniref:11915_t:CDS:1 n=1 Tax=Ambispora leptoticha TaxID=144679 RepID=A0A9N9EW74_9GLOM|nr:11915_t:CDS:2 [Ambispora leptoticha]
MRTIAALNREETFKTKYKDSIAGPHRTVIRGALIVATGFGAFQSLRSIGILVRNYSMSFFLFIMFTPNTANAKIVAMSVFKSHDRKCNMFNVEFSTTKCQNLRGRDTEILAGKNVALVGPSGLGKFTIISLFLQYYDIDSGTVNVERANVKDWNLEYLRSNMALVGQTLVLFDITIGYDTPVCEKRIQLNGGQKQRVAIARALIRNPKLLLNEATSALNSESEKVVQDALNRTQPKL